MISDKLQQDWVQVACLTDISAVGKGAIAVRDFMVKLQIEKLFKRPSFKSKDITDEKFWNNEDLKTLIARAIEAQKVDVQTLPAAVNALEAMSVSYRNALPNKTFGG